MFSYRRRCPIWPYVSRWLVLLEWGLHILWPSLTQELFWLGLHYQFWFFYWHVSVSYVWGGLGNGWTRVGGVGCKNPLFVPCFHDLSTCSWSWFLWLIYIMCNLWSWANLACCLELVVACYSTFIGELHLVAQRSCVHPLRFVPSWDVGHPLFSK